MSMRVISPQEAANLLDSSHVLANVVVAGHLDLRSTRNVSEDEIQVPITIQGCQIQSLSAACLVFKAKVAISKSTIKGGCSFFATYFLAGLEIVDSEFEGEVDFQCGGHNAPGCPVKLCRCAFHDFVNFFDCWYTGPLEITDCQFCKGSNLLGNVDKPYGVSLDASAMIERNTGDLNLNRG
jgi:hypothetical protein